MFIIVHHNRWGLEKKEELNFGQDYPCKLAISTKRDLLERKMFFAQGSYGFLEGPFFFCFAKSQSKRVGSWELFFFFLLPSRSRAGVVICQMEPHHPYQKFGKDMVDLIKWREMSQRGAQKKNCVWDKLFVKNDFCLDGIC